MNWKIRGESHYVMVLEPVNVNAFDGRAGTRAARFLPVLKSGHSVSYAIDFVLSSSTTRKATQ